MGISSARRILPRVKTCRQGIECVIREFSALLVSRCFRRAEGIGAKTPQGLGADRVQRQRSQTKPRHTPNVNREKIAQKIWDITKQMTKTRDFKNTRYHNVNTRVKALENLALIRKVVHELVVNAKISKKLPNSWMYSVRTHSLRKYFRTQMSAAKVDTEIIQYMMGHTVDTYEDVQSLGIETLRNLYTSAGLRIRPKTQANRIEQLKEIIRAWGENPEEILTKNALMRGNITETQEQTENHQLSLLAEQLKQLVKKEVSE